jgi:RNA polymerase sigma-B factor
VESSRFADASRGGLIESHLTLVRTIARRYVGRGAELDDLVQVGAVGLIKASDRFDPTRGVTFAAFAAPVIEGEIRHHLRDRTRSLRIPRKLEQMSAEVRRAQTELVSTLGRVPTMQELTAALGIDAVDVERALNAGSAGDWVSISAGDDSVAEATGTDGLADRDDRLFLNGGIRSLDERERRIVFLRFHADMTEREIAREVGISQAHVSRLLRCALAKLREGLADAAEAATAPDAAQRHLGDKTGPRISGVGTLEIRTLAEYLDLPYHLEVRSEHDGDRSWWTGSVEELPGCVSRGGTSEEALARLRPAMESWLGSALEEHREIPLPNKGGSRQEGASKSARSHSGRFLVRMPAPLHEQLAREAERAHVSLNRFITDALAACISTAEPERLGSVSQPRAPAVDRDPGSGATRPRALRVALATNVIVVVIAGVVALLLLALALQRGI